MTTLKIKVTKQILEESKYCTGENTFENCAIKLAVSGVFPNALVSHTTIYVDLANKIPLPREAKEFIRGWDVSTIEQRLAMDELEFEIQIPDEVLNSINIDELRPLLVNHHTLEIVN